MKFFSLLKTDDVRVRSSSSSWAWPSCHQPKTLSFRQYTKNNTNKNDVNAVIDDVVLETTESFFTESLHSESFSFSTVSEESRLGVDPIETVIRGLRSERLFFEPDETSSILTSHNNFSPFKNSIVLSVDSKEPYADFKKSMEEMVETHGVKDWETLEKLLSWYLQVNGKSNHVHIVTAFVDLLFELDFDASHESPPPSPSSEVYTSSSLSYCFNCEEEEEEVGASGSCFLVDEITPEDEASSSNS